MAQIECPRCKNKINSRATRCQHCHADFTQDELTEMQKKQTGSAVMWVVVSFVILLVLAATKCETSLVTVNAVGDGPQTKADNAIAAAEAVLANASAALGEGRSTNWTYNRRTDEIRNQEIVTASIRSENEVNFDFPYQGGSGLTLTVRKHPQYGQDVTFRIDKGQFLCGLYDCTGMISIDGKSEKLTLAPPADHDIEVLFAAYGPAIIKKLKGAKKVIVELPFYQEGNRQFTFDAAGLEWPPIAK